LQLRKEKEDNSIAELRFMIQKAEQALTAEVKRRVDATVMIETKTKRMVDTVEERLALRLQDQTDAMNGRMKELEERLDALETAVEQDAKAHKASIQKRGTELKLQLHELTRDWSKKRKLGWCEKGDSYSKWNHMSRTWTIDGARSKKKGLRKSGI
jgi:exonuclease VII large subunit